MSWYAIDAVEDALDVTREFLFPFDLRRWLTLAIMVFFLGGGSGGGSGVSNSVSSASTGPNGGLIDLGPLGTVDPSSQAFLTLVFAAVAVIVVLALLLGLIGAIMRFVFVDALRTGEARIRGRFGERTGKGIRLFAFQLVVVLVILVPIGLAVVPAILGFVSAIVVLLAIPFVFLFALVGGFTILFTDEFVVPVMIADDVGVLDGWRRFWPTLRREWKQFAVYVLVRIVLGIAISVIAGIVLGVVALPFIAIVGTVFFLTGLNLMVLLVVSIPVLLVFFVIAAIVGVPIQSYLTYVSLLVLGDANGAFDLIPDRRAAVRGE